MRSKTLLLPVLALLTLAAGSAASIPISRMSTPWWRERFAAKQSELQAHPPQLIFLGDSITENWEKNGPEDWRNFQPGWRHYYGDRQAINLGFKGDSTAHLLWRIRHGELDGIHPRVAVILIGANNFGRAHQAAEQTVEGIQAVVAETHRRLPTTKILLLSILPSRRSSWVDENTIQANQLLAQHASSLPNTTYVDVTNVFAPGGKLEADLFLDSHLMPPDPLLHPTAEGQARLSAAIEPTLAHLLGDRPKGP